MYLGKKGCARMEMLILNEGKELGGQRYSHRKLRAISICWCNERHMAFEIFILYLFIKRCALLGSAKWAWPRPNDTLTPGFGGGAFPVENARRLNL